jgi:diaminopimelate epimerase
MLRVTKLEATGNDFVVVDEDDGREPALSVAARMWLCDRHRGVGGDGVLTILRARDDVAARTGARYRMHITNPDGSVPEMCGNGLRCVGRYAVAEGLASGPELIVTGPVKVFAPERVRVPAPALVRPKPEPEITPPTVSVEASTVTVRVAFMATAPVPRLRVFEPRNVKSPFQF